MTSMACSNVISVLMTFKMAETDCSISNFYILVQNLTQI